MARVYDLPIVLRWVRRPDRTSQAQAARNAGRKPWLLVLALSLPALAAGCRGAAGRQDLIERELRFQEDRIFELEDQLERSHEMIGALESENSLLRNSEPVTVLPSSRAAISSQRPPAPAEDAESAPRYQAPEISPPDASRPEGRPRSAPSGAIPTPAPAPKAATPKAAEPVKSQDTVGPTVSEPPLRLPTLSVPPVGAEDESITAPLVRGASAKAKDQHVSAVTINRERTSGYNADGQTGDEGLTLIIEPRNAAGEIVDVPGQISVVVIDPMLDGPTARIARWDITPAQAESRLRAAPIGTGIPFQLRWPAKAPEHKSLDVFVRFTLPDGQRFDADAPVDIEPPLNYRPVPEPSPGPAAGDSPYRPRVVPSEPRAAEPRTADQRSNSAPRAGWTPKR